MRTGFLTHVKHFAQGLWTFTKSSVIAVVLIASPVLAGAVAIGVMVFTSLPGPVPEAKPAFVSRPAVLLDVNGEQIAVLRAFDEAQPTVPEDINEAVVDAVVSAEDRKFFEHTGVDPEGVARAAVANIEQGSTAQGGSTITQQLVKNQYLGGEQTISRKVREAVLAQRLEKEMTKDEILHAYLATSYFGSGAYGLASAAEVYFRVLPAELNVSQAAALAGMLPSPTANSPHSSIENAEAARLRTIETMVAAGRLTRQDADWYAQYRLVPVNVFGLPPEGTEGPYTAVWPRPESDLGPYPTFTNYVTDYLISRYGEKAVYQGGLVVETTLRPDLQQAAKDAAYSATEGASDPGTTAALAAIDPATGFIIAMADTGQWPETQVNYATGGSTGYQPGSSFKPFTVVAAMERGTSPDASITYGGQYVTSSGEVLRNYGGEGGGTTTIRDATRVSLNIPFVILADQVGPGSVAEVANRAGIKRLTPDQYYGTSITLGAYEVSPLDMASAYATFAARGLYKAPVPVVRVLNAEGQVLEDNTVRAGEQVFDPVVMDNINSVLRGVVDGGTGTSAKRGDRPVAGKTGTAENYTAAWFVGYTPNFSAAVWLGHNDGTRPLRIYGNGEIVGGGPPTRAWAQFANTALARFPVIDFVPPGPLPPPRPASGQAGGPPPSTDEPATSSGPPSPEPPSITGVKGGKDRIQTPE